MGLGFGFSVDEPRLARLDHVDSPLARRPVGVRGGEDGDLSLEIREIWGRYGVRVRVRVRVRVKSGLGSGLGLGLGLGFGSGLGLGLGLGLGWLLDLAR